MSWSGQATAQFGSAQENADVVHNMKCGGQEDLPEAQEAITAAKETAITLVNGGFVGGQGEFYVSLSGHANPEHVAPEGWSYDSITINVSQRPKPFKADAGRSSVSPSAKAA